MRVSESEAKMYDRAKRSLHFRWIVALIAFSVWIIWLALISYRGFPRLEIPLPTVLFIVIATYSFRPVVSGRVLALLDRYLAADPEAMDDIRAAHGAPRATRE